MSNHAVDSRAYKKNEVRGTILKNFISDILKKEKAGT